MKRRGFFGAVAAAAGAAACAASLPIFAGCASARVEVGRLRDYGNLRDVFLRTAPSLDWKPHSYRVMVMTTDRLDSRIVSRESFVENISPGAFICLHTMRAGDTFIGARVEVVS